MEQTPLHARPLFTLCFFFIALIIAPQTGWSVYNQEVVIVGDQAQQVASGEIALDFETEDGEPVDVVSTETKQEDDGSTSFTVQLGLQGNASQAMNMTVKPKDGTGAGTTTLLPAAAIGDQIVVDPTTGVYQFRPKPSSMAAQGPTFTLSANYNWGFEEVPQIRSNALINPPEATESSVNKTEEDIDIDGWGVGLTYRPVGLKNVAFKINYWDMDGSDSTRDVVEPFTQDIAILFPLKYMDSTGFNFAGSNLGILAHNKTEVDTQGLQLGFSWPCGRVPALTSNVYFKYGNYDVNHFLRSHVLPEDAFNISTDHHVDLDEDRFRIGFTESYKVPISSRFGLNFRAGAFLGHVSADVSSKFSFGWEGGPPEFQDIRINQSDDVDEWYLGLNGGAGVYVNITDRLSFDLDAYIESLKQASADFGATGDAVDAGAGLDADTERVNPYGLRIRLNYDF